MLYFISQVALMTLTSGNYHYQVRQLPQQVFSHKLVPKPSSSQNRYSHPSHKIFFGFLCPKLTSNIYDSKETRSKGTPKKITGAEDFQQTELLSTNCKKCIFTIENSKKLRKFFKILLDKQIFPSSDTRFCHDTRNDGCNTQNFHHNMHNFSLYLANEAQGGLKEPQKFQCLKLIFRPFGTKKKEFGK